jgi:polyhydroxybutyrate depolymerase
MTGGNSATGGNGATGGNPATGGNATTGGQSATGGQLATGGNSATGGQARATGGSTGSGGQDAGVGDAGLGGATSTGGATVATCPSTVLSPGNTTRTIQSGGRSRTYILHVPSAYKGNKAVPLLVDFHPHGSTGPAWQTGSPFPAVVDSEGVISAFPTAITDWNVGPCCSDGVDDVAFAKALVSEVKGLACIDPKRVYAAGFSMGGGMTNFVACHASDIFAAFAPAAFDILKEIVEGCKPVRPIAVASFRGTADSYVPYAGGLSNLVKPINFLGAVNTMKKWAELNGCTGSATDIGNGCQGYAPTQCPAGVEVILCTKQGGGHDAANATLIWPMLKRHALP